MAKYALRETLASKKQHHDVWYRFWTVIGPACTSNPAERALMTERDHWLQSKALRHSLTFFEIVELPDNALGDLDWNKQ